MTAYDKVKNGWNRDWETDNIPDDMSNVHMETCPDCDMPVGEHSSGCPQWTESKGQEILVSAIRHIRRMHMNCRFWMLPQGDDAAVKLMIGLYQQIAKDPEFDRINHGPFEHPTEKL